MNEVNQVETEVIPITMPGVHQRFLQYFKGFGYERRTKVLDVGAGYGALSQKLLELGYRVEACDLFPEKFRVSGVECRKVDVTGTFPYPDHSFDQVIAVEVTEHIIDHEMFFSEVHRILKNGGQLHISTPNILSMKSRIRFLFQGFFFAFNPLEMNNYDGLQHVASITLDQYNYMAVKHGFGEAQVNIDREQGTSRWLLILMQPWFLLYRLINKIPPIHHDRKLLLGRLLFMKFSKVNNEKQSI